MEEIWWMLYLWKPTAVILALLVLFGALAEPVQKLIDAAVMINYHETKDLPLSEADIPKLYEQSPLDEEGAKRIDAIPAVGASVKSGRLAGWQLDSRFYGRNYD